MPRARHHQARAARQRRGDPGGGLRRRAQVLLALDDERRHGRIRPTRGGHRPCGIGPAQAQVDLVGEGDRGVEREERARRQRHRRGLRHAPAIGERRAARPRERRLLAHGPVARGREVARRRRRGQQRRSGDQPLQRRGVVVVERRPHGARERGAQRRQVVRVESEVRHPLGGEPRAAPPEHAPPQRPRAQLGDERRHVGRRVAAHVPAARRAQRAQRRRDGAKAREAEDVGVVRVGHGVEDQAVDAVGVGARVGERERGAVRDPQQAHPLQPERLADRLHVLDRVGRRVEAATRAEPSARTARRRAWSARARRPRAPSSAAGRSPPCRADRTRRR